MRISIFIFLMFCPVWMQAQSKKNLRLQVEQLKRDSSMLQNELLQQDSIIRAQNLELENKKRELANLRTANEQKSLELNKEIKRLEIDIETLKSQIPSNQKEASKIIPSKQNVTPSGNSGKGNKTDNPKSNTSGATSDKHPNPFGGVGGKGGNESGFSGKGPGTGPGPGGLGDGSGRVRLNDPKVNDISSDQNHVINLRLKINADGNIVEVTNIASKTTTTDERILNQVIAAVKSQVKYSKKEGAGLELVYITVNLNAN